MILESGVTERGTDSKTVSAEVVIKVVKLHEGIKGVSWSRKGSGTRMEPRGTAKMRSERGGSSRSPDWENKPFDSGFLLP